MKKRILPMLALLLAVMLCACTPGGNDTTDAADTTASAVETTAETADAASTDAPEVKVDVNVAMLKGPTGMGAAYLMKQANENAASNNYNFTLESAADAVVAGIINGTYDIAAVPTNLAATLYAKDGVDVRVIAVNTLGVLYVLEKGNSINSVSDLAGKKIITSGQGTAADAVLTRLISANIADASSVDITYASEHSETVTRAMTGGYDIAVLPEPFVTMLLTKSNEFRIALNLTSEWENAGYGKLVMGAVIATKAFTEAHPEAVDAFLTDYAASVEYVNGNNEQAAALIEEFGIATAAVAVKALPNCNIVCMTGNDMKTALAAFYEQLNAFKPALVGGSIPGDDLYYVK